jgi:polysaccharide export outer membrane protein
MPSSSTRYERGTIVNPFTRALCLVLACSLGAGPLGCRNPAQSSLPPSAVVTPDSLASLPPLPKGDLYADETLVSTDALIEPGDALDVIIYRGFGEEKYTGIVHETGTATVSFLEVPVKGLTSAQVETLIEKQAAPFMKNPRVQVVLKKKNPKLKRIFIFGDVKKPGQYPLARNMTVMQALTHADNYNETALLDEIRVIRGGNLANPQIVMADLSRVFTYGDMSRNIALQENDIVFVPRERIGDAQEAAKKMYLLVFMALTPIYFATLLPTFTTTPVAR